MILMTFKKWDSEIYVAVIGDVCHIKIIKEAMRC